MAGELLRADVTRPDAPIEFVQALIELCEGARIHDLESRANETSRTLMRNDASAWSDLCNRVLRLFRRRIQAGDQADQVSAEEIQAILEDFSLGSEADRPLTGRQLQEMFRRLSEGRVSGLLTAVVDDFISFDYRDRDGFIRFEKASPGQQASALLQLLLNQEAGTLIIDQPEDDLDSGVVMEIVSLLRRTKQKRQVIFATHNPNFVVNGDADKVIALRPSAGGGPEVENGGPRVRFWVDGALENAQVRDAVIKTMDGGREAFELRRRKYHFADSEG